MKGHGCLVMVKDTLGDKFICTLDSLCSLDKCNDVVSTLDGHRKVPTTIEELSAHERRTCRDFGPTAGAQPVDRTIGG